jgi:sRNA-binding regulator protein Hfq
LVYKHAISTIMPLGTFSLLDSLEENWIPHFFL